MSLVSVVVCTRNPRSDFFRRVLSALAAQTLPRNRWELLVVDNASDQSLAGSCDLSWHPQGRQVRESIVGLTPARLRGIEETRGNLAAFVRDDNVIAPDYLTETLLLSDRCPFLAVFGSGAIEPEFEAQPSNAVRPHLPLLALRSTTGAKWSNHPEDHSVMPWGAGLVVRRAVADRYRAFTVCLGIDSILDRRGTRLYAGGDDLFSWLAASA